MFKQDHLQSLLQHIAIQTGQSLHQPRLTPVGGGDINTAYQLQAAGVNWFVKLNRADRLQMFAAEAAGLAELAASHTLQVPQVLGYGSYQQYSYLLLNFVDMTVLRGNSVQLLGQQLAQLHGQPKPYFGWSQDNTIGSTAQINTPEQGWCAFWQQQRLGKQLQFAARQGYAGALQSQGEKLLQQLPYFFSDYQPQPCLLHGDLWSGNAAADRQGNPLIFDPACYYGDRETDIAMTELFGGFAQDFYAAYQAEYPLDVGYSTRKTLYNLYHILNHLNLFGSGYLGQAKSMIEKLLAEL